MPVTIMDPDPDSAVISRFCIPESQNSGLPAEKDVPINVCMQPARLFLVPGVRQDVWQETLSRDITAQQRYTVLARGFQRTVFAGDDDPRTGMVQRLHLEPRQGNGLVHFSGRTPFRKPTSSDARPSSDDTPLSGGCSETGKVSDKSLVKPLFSGSSVVMWKRCRKPGTEPVIS